MYSGSNHRKKMRLKKKERKGRYKGGKIAIRANKLKKVKVMLELQCKVK